MLRKPIIFAVLIGILSLIRTSGIRLKDSLISALIAFSYISYFCCNILYIDLGNRVGSHGPNRFIIHRLDTNRITDICIVYTSPNESVRFRITRKIPTKYFLLHSHYIVHIISRILRHMVLRQELWTSSVSDVGVVPWFIYPLMLGSAGLLSILSIKYIGTENQRDDHI